MLPDQLAEATSQPAPSEGHQDVLKTLRQWSACCRAGTPHCTLLSMCVIWWRTGLTGGVCAQRCVIIYECWFSACKYYCEEGDHEYLFLVFFPSYVTLVFSLVIRKFFKILESRRCDLDAREPTDKRSIDSSHPEHSYRHSQLLIWAVGAAELSVQH